MSHELPSRHCRWAVLVDRWQTTGTCAMPNNHAVEEGAESVLSQDLNCFGQKLTGPVSLQCCTTRTLINTAFEPAEVRGGLRLGDMH